MSELKKPLILNLELADTNIECYHWWKRCCEVWEAYHNQEMRKKDSLIGTYQEICFNYQCQVEGRDKTILALGKEIEELKEKNKRSPLLEIDLI